MYYFKFFPPHEIITCLFNDLVQKIGARINKIKNRNKNSNQNRECGKYSERFQIISRDDDMLNLGGYKSPFYSQQHFFCLFISKIRGAQ